MQGRDAMEAKSVVLKAKWMKISVYLSTSLTQCSSRGASLKGVTLAKAPPAYLVLAFLLTTFNPSPTNSLSSTCPLGWSISLVVSWTHPPSYTPTSTATSFRIMVTFLLVSSISKLSLY